MIIDRDQPARLYRSRVYYRDQVDPADSEKISDGNFAKMLRVALSDPDDEICQYSIRSATMIFEGDDARNCRVVTG